MGNASDVIQEVRELWNGVIEDCLEESHKERLNSVLDGSAKARAEYIALMKMHCSLSRHFLSEEPSGGTPLGSIFSDEIALDIESSDDFDLEAVLALEAESQRVASAPKSQEKEAAPLLFSFLQAIPNCFSQNGFQIFVILALLLPSAFAFLLFFSSSRYSSVAASNPIVTQTKLANWGGNLAGPIRAGFQLTKGQEYLLESGFAEIMFPTDAKIVIHGPTTFVVTANNLVHLDSGRCVAHVPPAASGFTIETNGTRIVDLGTEFGVETDGDMETEVYVFQGKVELEIKETPGESKDEKIELLANEGRRFSAQTGTITSAKLDFKRFIRNINADGVIASLPIRNPSFEESDLSTTGNSNSNSMFHSASLPYWHTNALASQRFQGNVQGNQGHSQNPDIGCYLKSSSRGLRLKPGVTNGKQSCAIALRDGTTEGTKASKSAWIYLPLGRVQPKDVRYSLKLSTDCFAGTPQAEKDSKITIGFATKASAWSSGSFVGSVGTISGAEIWERPHTIETSMEIPIGLVGKELFIVIQVEDDSPGSGEDVYLIDNLRMEYNCMYRFKN